ncbi:MAG: hypothetical protein ACKVU4_03580 [Phycisphaerales bacterium]
MRILALARVPRCAGLFAGLAVGAAAFGQAPAEPALKGVALFQKQAASLAPTVETDPARQFLQAVGALPTIEPRTFHRNREKRLWLTKAQFDALPEGERSGFEEAVVDEDMYYQTRYGSPLAYVRAIDLAVKVGGFGGGRGFAGMKIADYGHGTVGHLRMWGALGALVTGIEVDPFLKALYSEPGDTGVVPSDLHHGPPGSVTLVHGLWPGGEGPDGGSIAAKIGGGYDMFISKNTLKNGYIHPAKPVEKRLLVDLSVSEEAFVKAIFDALKPGGLCVIYNLGPAPSKEGDAMFKHWADGRSPFGRAAWEAAGFEVLAFDVIDDGPARRMFEALEYPTKDKEGGDDLFAWYTIARRPK